MGRRDSSRWFNNLQMKKWHLQILQEEGRPLIILRQKKLILELRLMGKLTKQFKQAFNHLSKRRLDLANSHSLWIKKTNKIKEELNIQSRNHPNPIICDATFPLPIRHLQLSSKIKLSNNLCEPFSKIHRSVHLWESLRKSNPKLFKRNKTSSMCAHSHFH